MIAKGRVARCDRGTSMSPPPDRYRYEFPRHQPRRESTVAAGQAFLFFSGSEEVADAMVSPSPRDRWVRLSLARTLAGQIRSFQRLLDSGGHFTQWAGADWAGRGGACGTASKNKSPACAGQHHPSDTEVAGPYGTVRAIVHPPPTPIIEATGLRAFPIADAAALRADASAVAEATGIHNVLLEMSGTTHTPTASEIVLFHAGDGVLRRPVEPTECCCAAQPHLTAATWTGLYATAMAASRASGRGSSGAARRPSPGPVH